MTLIDPLIATRDALLPLFAADAAALARSYSPEPGKWDLRRLLLHVADTEQVLLDRLRRLLADEQPLLLAFDEDRWTAALFPERRDLGLAAECFRAAREAAIELVRLCPHDLRAREGRHSQKGTRTFQQIAEFIPQHTAHHLGQMRACLEGRVWTRAEAVV